MQFLLRVTSNRSFFPIVTFGIAVQNSLADLIYLVKYFLHLALHFSLFIFFSHKFIEALISSSQNIFFPCQYIIVSTLHCQNLIHLFSNLIPFSNTVDITSFLFLHYLNLSTNLDVLFLELLLQFFCLKHPLLVQNSFVFISLVILNLFLSLFR